MSSSQAASSGFGVATCPVPAKVQLQVEEENTPATVDPDTDSQSECDDDRFGIQDSDATPAEAPRQLSAGIYEDPTEEELQARRQQQPPPVQVARPVQPPAPAAAPAPAPASACTAASKDTGFSFSETFFVFDYDDTILPSTWINRQGLRLDAGSRPTPQQLAVLGEAAALAAKTIKFAMQRGTVIFVTNAERGWLELSCHKFMPTLAPLLENIRLVSARTSYQGPLAPSPLDWKVCAFEAALEHHFGADGLSDPSQRKNVLSLGDGIHEREALLQTTMSLPACFPKSLKFVERPDISQILKQHELIAGNFDSIVNHAGNLDLRIQCP